MSKIECSEEDLALATRWCEGQGKGWKVLRPLGKGGTAPVYAVEGPTKSYALKILDKHFCEGPMGELTRKRIDMQVALGDHGCPYLIVCHGGGPFEDRLFLLMDQAEGKELEERLPDIPRQSIRPILQQITRAVLFLREKGLCHRDIKSANIYISGDFKRCVLLDISVLREIVDPVGIGTDHDNQLPVVATSRYTPPEYLFRLIDPSEELWHGLDVYQLGALLHDLIMRRPMFAAEYAVSKENRYRFAWIVATVDPEVSASDVDQDLVLLARRSLDKKWERRRKIDLEDFLSGKGGKRQSLAALGIEAPLPVGYGQAEMPLPWQIIEIAGVVDESISSYLIANGVVPTHSSTHGAHDCERIVCFSWFQASELVDKVTIRVILALNNAKDSIFVSARLEAIAALGTILKTAETELPDTRFCPKVAETVAAMLVSAISDIAIKIMTASESR